MTIFKSGYGLLHKKTNTIIGVRTESTNADCSVNEINTLDYDVEPMWLVDTKLNASYVRENSTHWYNAGYTTPVNPFEPEELEVIKIEVKADIEEPIDIPSMEEYFHLKYNVEGSKSYDPKYYKYFMESHKKHPYIMTLYDLQELMKNE